MEDIDGGLHPAVDGQSLDEDEDEEVDPIKLSGWELNSKEQPVSDRYCFLLGVVLHMPCYIAFL